MEKQLFSIYGRFKALWQRQEPNQFCTANRKIFTGAIVMSSKIEEYVRMIEMKQED